MAGDWIKMEKRLRDKPEVISIAQELGIADRDFVVGKLHRLWSWFDDQTTDGNAPRVTPAFVDSLVALDGFAVALANAGWLSVRQHGISMPKFDRHLSKSAKNRALGQERSQRFRNGATVTPPLPEKRREEKSKEEPPISPKGDECESSPGRFQKPSVAEVAEFCANRKNGIDAEEFIAHYASKGWRVGKSPMKDWRAAVVTWEKQRAKDGKTKGAEYPDLQ